MPRHAPKARVSEPGCPPLQLTRPIIGGFPGVRQTYVQPQTSSMFLAALHDFLISLPFMDWALVKDRLKGTFRAQLCAAEAFRDPCSDAALHVNPA